jgi:hemerythrin-like domain-containing protein
MTGSGVPKEGGPIGVMLAEHEQGRAFNRGMEAAARAMAAGDSSQQGELVRNALGYVSLLRQHIDKEDGVLFPMAEQAIPAAAQEKLAEEFERIEREETGAGVHEKFHALAEKLAAEAAG